MNKRVTVDARALYDLIQAARATQESLICIGSVNPAQERKDLTKMISRLAVQEVSE